MPPRRRPVPHQRPGRWTCGLAACATVSATPETSGHAWPHSRSAAGHRGCALPCQASPSRLAACPLRYRPLGAVPVLAGPRRCLHKEERKDDIEIRERELT